MMDRNNAPLWRTLDWQTVFFYIVLVLWGWATIYSASYDFDSASIFSMGISSGKQLLWIGISLVVGMVLLLTDSHVYYNIADVIYLLILAVLLVTRFVAPDIKGSHSWLYFGSFSIQPAEFAKFATALILAKYIDKSGFNPARNKRYWIVFVLIFLPALLIVLQNETGSALVYVSFLLVLYREGLSGSLLSLGLCAIVFFIMSIRFGGIFIFEKTVLGSFLVLLLVQILFLCFFYSENHKEKNACHIMILVQSVCMIVGLIVNLFVVHFNLCWLQYGLLAASSLYILILFFKKGLRKTGLILGFILGSIVFLFAADYLFEEVLEPHQRTRIEVFLGIVDDPTGTGYNVNQAKIAIGSGGLLGKGYLKGTQTKLKYVPEQDTDFIFCTVGEEFGFIGCVLLIGLYVYLLVRLIQMAERQRNRFARVYGYSVVSILFFHLLINIGMVIGVMPVIGIPLPFFSYGGSSLLGFTTLLFIFLRLDADRFRYN